MNIRVIRNSITVLLLFLLFRGISSPLPPDVVREGKYCISLVMDDKYEQALKEADKIIKKHPKSSVGYFVKAAVLHYYMLYLGEKKYANTFYSICDKSIELGKKNPNDDWEQFFVAGTIGVRGAYERSRNRLVTSLKLGWKAIDILRPLKAKGNKDALYGLGVYDYWVGANIKLLWWVKGATDNRVGALKDLNNCIVSGVFTNDIVLYDLLDMYSNEKDYNNLLRISNKILKKHPQNIKALENQFVALINLQQYDLAKKNIQKRDAIAKSRKLPPVRVSILAAQKKRLSSLTAK